MTELIHEDLTYLVRGVFFMVTIKDWVLSVPYLYPLLSLMMEK